MYPDLLHPWVGKLTSFPINACASRQPSLPQEYQCQRYAKREYSTDTIGYVATNTAGNAATSPTPPSSNQLPRQLQAQFQLSSG
jgi:hypothetical protein